MSNCKYNIAGTVRSDVTRTSFSGNNLAACSIKSNIIDANVIKLPSGEITIGGASPDLTVINSTDITTSNITATNGNFNDLNVTNTLSAAVFDLDTVNATDINATGTLSAAVFDLDTVNTTTLNTTDINATGTFSVAAFDITTVNATDINATGTLSAAVFDLDTVNTTTLNTTDINATGTFSAATFDLTTVNATTVNTTDLAATGTVSGPIGALTTVNATTVNTTDLAATGTVSGPIGALTTVNATTVNTTDLAATGTVAAPLGVIDEIQDATNVKYYGAVGDGVTDDTAAFNAAFVATQTLGVMYIPAGVYNITAETFTQNVSLPSNFTLYGDGKGTTLLNFTATTNATFFYIFSIANDHITIRDFSLTWNGTINSSFGPIFSTFSTCDNITMDGLGIDMGVFNNGGSRSWFSAVWNMGEGVVTSTNVSIKNCDVKNNVWGFLKSNTNISTQRKWTFSNNLFQNFFSPQLTFNTPSGVMSDVKVIGNTFDTSFAALTSSSGFNHSGGVAGGDESYNFIFDSNQFVGQGTGLHFEEGAELIVISNNNFRMSDEAVEMLDNDIGGVRHIPQKFVICGNTMEQSGTPEASARGIQMIFDVSGFGAGRTVVITDNVISGYERGISLSETLGMEFVISNNIITSCDFGIYVVGPVGDTVSNNLIKDCGVGMEFSRGGMSGKNTFYSNTTNLTKSGQACGLAGWSVSQEYITGSELPTGSTAIVLMPLPVAARMSGRISYTLAALTAGSSRVGTSAIDWDGTTLTVTPETVGGAGTVSFTSISRSGDNLIITFNNGSGAVTTGSLSVTFIGGYFLL
jgi:hypothetical protein